MKLGELLTTYRIANDLTLEKLASKIGIEKTALFRFEKGRSVSNKKFTKIVTWALN